MQVRVRRKNPLIERLASELPIAGHTHAAETLTPEPAPPLVAPSMYDEDESSETTQEFDLRDREALVDTLRPKKRARSSNKKVRAREVSPPALVAPPVRLPPGYNDEDETQIADEMPSLGPIVDPAPRVIIRDDLAGPSKKPVRIPTVDQAGVVPRGLLGKWGTKAVGAAARKANTEKKADAMVHVAHPLLKPVRSELSRDHLASLERILSGELDERGIDATLSPKRSLEHLINEPGFNELALNERALLLSAIAYEPRDIATTKSAIALMKSGVARRMKMREREQLFGAFVAFNSECRALLARLSARPLRSRSALEDRDFEDAALVSHLHTIARELKVALPITRAGFRADQVATLVLSSIANPERLAFEEGADGVLSILEFGLADGSPAELVRLWIELLRGDMNARLAGEGEIDLGAKLRSHPELRFSVRETPIRVGLELLSGLANPRRGGDRSAFIMPGGHGVDADVISRSLALLYSVGFTVAAGAPTALRHLERTSSDQQRVPPVFVTMLYDRGERMFVFDRLDGGDILVRAPHGRSSKRKGAQRVDPPRVVEDADAGLDRLAREHLDESLGVALVPR